MTRLDLCPGEINGGQACGEQGCELQGIAPPLLCQAKYAPGDDGGSPRCRDAKGERSSVRTSSKLIMHTPMLMRRLSGTSHFSVRTRPLIGSGTPRREAQAARRAPCRQSWPVKATWRAAARITAVTRASKTDEPTGAQGNCQTERRGKPNVGEGKHPGGPSVPEAACESAEGDEAMIRLTSDAPVLSGRQQPA